MDLAHADRVSEDLVVDLPSLGVFDGCHPALLGALDPPLEELDVEPGETIVREGHLGHEWYVILDGQVEVIRGSVPVATLGPGDHFGEIALLNRIPRTVTIRALVPTRILLVLESTFHALMTASPEFAHRITEAAAVRRTYLENVSTSPG
jgi:CRP-like cAMP-binding protein